MFAKRKYHLLPLLFVSALWVQCGTSVTNPAPSPSSAPVVAAFTTTSGTSIGTTGTTDVPIASAFSITFSTAMTTSTLTTSTLTLSCSSSSQTVTVTTVGNNAATVTPASSMPEGATCIFTATTGVQSAGGVAMAAAATFTFTTVAGTPTVSSVTGTATSTGSSATIATTGTTGISGATAAPLTTTFSTAMSSSTVTSGMTLQCGGTSQTVTNAASSTTAFTTTPSSALPQMASCVLTLPATIQSSSGGALAATTYTYTTGCGTSDDFSNSSTLSSCWTAAESSAATISIASNVLNMSTSTDPGFSQVQEYKSFGSDNVTVTVSVPTFSGITSSGDNCGIWIQDGSSAITGVMLLVSPNGGNIVAFSDTLTGGDPVIGSSLGTGTSSAALSGTLFLRITQSGTSFTMSYRVGSSGAFTDLDTTTASVGSTKKIALLLNSDGSGTTNCQYANFTVTGATATGQYSN